VPWTKHTSINISANNTIKVVAVGTNFSFYINNLKVKELFDPSFREGKFGIYGFKTVHAAFSSVILYQGNLIFYDYFSKPSENWSEGEGAYTKDGVYNVDAMAQDYYTWTGEPYKNISLKTEAIWRAGETAKGYGIVFRFVDINNYYAFAISKTGYYYFGYAKDNKWTTLVDWKKSRMLNADGKNILRVECMGETFALYLNDNLVETVTDGTFTEGTIGFFAFKGVKVAFDNVELFLLDKE
jgi:hypothetical protein